MANTPNVKINKINETEVELEGGITWEELKKYQAESLKYFQGAVKLPGFREGHIPENVLREKVGPMAILEDMAERALRDIYPSIIIDNKIEAIDRPNIMITKIAEGSPLGFKIKQTVLPLFDLPDYKKIAGKINKKLDDEDKGIEVTDEELNKVIEEIKKARKEQAGGDAEKITDLTDEERANVKANMQNDKELRARDKRRMAIVDGLLAETKITVPSVLIEKQMDRFMLEMKGNIESMKIKWEDYIKHLKKSESEIREGGRVDAEKRVKTELILEQLGKEAKIEADQAEIDKEVNHILEHHKNADPENVRDYVSNILRNTKVFEFLESLR